MRRGPPDKYNWQDVQKDYNAGLSPSKCMSKYGFCSSTWLKAERSGKLRTDPSRRYKRGGHNCNLVGLTFGRLTVVSKNADLCSKKAYVWNCQCSCGNQCTATTGALNSSSKISCGCARSEAGKKNPKWTGCEEISGSYWSSIKHHCKRNGRALGDVPFNLCIKEAWDLYISQGKKCALSGTPISFGRARRDRTASLDRIDSKKGYSIDNVWWVHKDVNYIKMDLPVDEFLMWIKAIYERNFKQTNSSES